MTVINLDGNSEWKWTGGRAIRTFRKRSFPWRPFAVIGILLVAGVWVGLLLRFLNWVLGVVMR